jgi:ParB family chromosome partitioning protein
MSRTSRGLGRGLASLIPDSALDVEPTPTDRSALRIVPIDEIRPNPEQPRHVFVQADLDSLAASIRVHGVLSPLVVRRHEGRYILIAGERRLRASAMAGLSEVPVIVREADDPSRQLEVALVENLQRADLDPIESARGFQRLVDEYGYTQDQVATAVSKDRSTVANLIRLLRLPEFVLNTLREGRISSGHARALLPLTDEDELRRTLSKILAHGLNVRATERLVAELVKVPAVVKAQDRQRQERTMDYAVKLLQDALHTSVDIKPKKKGGTIVIDYADAEDLERLISKLRS